MDQLLRWLLNDQAKHLAENRPRSAISAGGGSCRKRMWAWRGETGVERVNRLNPGTAMGGKAWRPVWILAATLLLLLVLAPRADAVSPLYARGYTVLPEPQQVAFKGGDFEFGSGWRLALGQSVSATDVAVESLEKGLARRYGAILKTSGKGGDKTIELRIQPGAVQIGEAADNNKAALAEQAYALELTSDRIRIRANAPAGLLYGVETLIQLVKPDRDKLWLPTGRITDWPDLENRFIYWDDRAHLDHIDILEQAIRQCAFYKINGIMIKLNGHFEFASAPAVVEPYAFSPAQLQALTNYGLRYHVQLIPYVDGPAHIAWILKHPEYKRLREFPESNYELCSTNADSYKLLDGMYQDLLNANKGVKYFVLSTDEPYYVGLAHNPQCDEAARAKALGSVGKLLAEFVTKAGDYLHEHGRTVIFWGEYPLKPADIPSLPGYLINGEVYGPHYDPVFKAHGIRQMFFTYTEGSENLFPNYYLLPPSEEYNYRPMSQADQAHYRLQRSRISEMFNEISFWPARTDADIMGVDVCGWGDNGLHPETFWLGFATIAGWGWHPGSPSPDEAMSDFYNLYYGQGAVAMGRLYQLMSTQAEFWDSSWDWAPSTARKPLFGNSEGIFNPPRPAREQTLPLPPAPQGEYLRLPYDWNEENATRVKMAQDFMPANDELIDLLDKNLRSVQLHRYNIGVYLPIAHLYRQNLEMLQELGQISGLLKGAQEAAAHVQFSNAVAALDGALDLAREIRVQRNSALQSLVTVWDKTWYPRVAEANGRKHLFALNDVHDYRVDRARGFDYLIERELLFPLGKWFDEVEEARNQYARAHGLAARTDKLDWNETSAGADPRGY
jgi:hexosaminidase